MKTYRIYISGKIGPRHSQLILHNMLKDLGLDNISEQVGNEIPTIRNMHRGNEEGYFDVDIYNDNNAASIVDSMKMYIIENAVQYEDITNNPPTNMFDSSGYRS
jgi:hypothetical protein